MRSSRWCWPRWRWSIRPLWPNCGLSVSSGRVSCWLVFLRGIAPVRSVRGTRLRWCSWTATIHRPRALHPHRTCWPAARRNCDPALVARERTRALRRTTGPALSGRCAIVSALNGCGCSDRCVPCLSGSDWPDSTRCRWSGTPLCWRSCTWMIPSQRFRCPGENNGNVKRTLNRWRWLNSISRGQTLSPTILQPKPKM